MEHEFNPYTPPTNSGSNRNYRINKPKTNYFEIAAFTCGIASLLCGTVIYIAYFFGGLAILFALLSRGEEYYFTHKAKISLFMGVGGLLISTVIFGVTFVILLEEYGSLEGILRAGSEMLGIDFETEFGSLFQ